MHIFINNKRIKHKVWHKNLRSACQKEKPLKPYMLVVCVCWDMTMNKTGQFHLWLSSIPIKRHNKKLFQELCYSCIEKPCYICTYYPRSMLNSQLNGKYCKQMVTKLPKPIYAVNDHATRRNITNFKLFLLLDKCYTYVFLQWNFFVAKVKMTIIADTIYYTHLFSKISLLFFEPWMVFEISFNCM